MRPASASAALHSAAKAAKPWRSNSSTPCTISSMSAAASRLRSQGTTPRVARSIGSVPESRTRRVERRAERAVDADADHDVGGPGGSRRAARSVCRRACGPSTSRSFGHLSCIGRGVRLRERAPRAHADREAQRRDAARERGEAPAERQAQRAAGRREPLARAPAAPGALVLGRQEIEVPRRRHGAPVRSPRASSALLVEASDQATSPLRRRSRDCGAPAARGSARHRAAPAASASR